MPRRFAELERLGEDLGQADVLVDLDHPARAHHAEVGPRRTHTALGLARLGRDDDDRVARANGIDLAADRRRDGPPVLAGSGE